LTVYARRLLVARVIAEGPPVAHVGRRATHVEALPV